MSGWADRHIGRGWRGTDLEDGCPCPKAPCGLVPADQIDPACPQHGFDSAKTIRQNHAPEDCPGPASASEADTACLDALDEQPRAHDRRAA